MNEPEKIDPRELSPLALAFVGDSVLELLVRQRLVEHHRLSAGKLNAEKVKYVSARAQFREEQLLEPLFTEDELAVFKRGRNASKASVAKHASPEEYRASTGFECLLGWLYLNGQLGRVHELFETLWQQFDPNETREVAFIIIAHRLNGLFAAIQRCSSLQSIRIAAENRLVWRQKAAPIRRTLTIKTTSDAKARCFPHWKTVPEGSGLCDLRKIRGSRPWSIRREGQRQRLFLALLERLFVEFLELSSSAPLVYWLGCLCSLVALLVVWLDVRFEV